MYGGGSGLGQGLVPSEREERSMYGGGEARLKLILSEAEVVPVETYIE